MRANEQSRLPHQSDGAAAAGTSGGGGASRASKKQKQEKIPQRGLGVAELERILREKHRGGGSGGGGGGGGFEPPDAALWRDRPPPMVPALPSTTGAGNLQMEPPSNQISIGSSKNIPLPLPEDERISGMKRPWPFHLDNDQVSSSLVCSRPVFTMAVHAPSVNVHGTFQSDSRCGNTNRNGPSLCSEPDKQFLKEDTDQAKDGRFLALGSPAPPIPPITPLNSEMKQPLLMIPPLFGMRQFHGNIVDSSPWRPIRPPFYEFLPMAPSSQREKNAEEKSDKSSDGIDLNLKL